MLPVIKFLIVKGMVIIILLLVLTAGQSGSIFHDFILENPMLSLFIMLAALIITAVCACGLIASNWRGALRFQNPVMAPLIEGFMDDRIERSNRRNAADEIRDLKAQLRASGIRPNTAPRPRS